MYSMYCMYVQCTCTNVYMYHIMWCILTAKATIDTVVYMHVRTHVRTVLFSITIIYCAYVHTYVICYVYYHYDNKKLHKYFVCTYTCVQCVVLCVRCASECHHSPLDFFLLHLQTITTITTVAIIATTTSTPSGTSIDIKTITSFCSPLAPAISQVSTSRSVAVF